MARSLAGTGAVVLIAACAHASGGQAAGALRVRTADLKHEASTITVTDVAQLKSALASAHGGDTIRLAPGAYSGLGRLTGLNYASRVTVTSADASHPAVVMPFWIVKSSNIAFTHMEFSGAGSTDSNPYAVYDSTNIAFDHDSFHGDMDAAPSAAPSRGLGLSSGANISITNSDFTHLWVGMGISGTNGAVVSSNSFHQIRCDGIEVAPAVNIEVTRNVFTDFRPAPGDHPDAIQLWGRGTNGVTISENLYVRGQGAPTDGIFAGFNPGDAKNIVISNNTIVGAGYHGIDVSNVSGLTVSSNAVAAFHDYGDSIELANIIGGSETNNSANGYAGNGNANFTRSGNVTNSAVTDSGAALTKQWVAAHSDWTGILPASLLDLVGATSTANGRAGALSQDRRKRNASPDS